MLRLGLRSGLRRRLDDFNDRRADGPAWPHHVLLVIGMPKSGTTWLAELLENVPRYRGRPFVDPDNCIARHDVCDAALASVPRDLYSVLKLHTVASGPNLAVLERFGEPAVIMHRDLRDQAVSRYFHVKQELGHPDYALYNAVPEAEGLLHSIDVATSEYRDWIEGWLPVFEREPARYKEVRYEWLRAEPARIFDETLGFFDIDLGEGEAERIVETVRANTTFDLAASRKRSQTARAGVVGGWRKHFGDEHVARFKERAGDLLVRLGYERDLDWTA